MQQHSATQSQMHYTSKMPKAVLGTNIITCTTCSSKPAYIWKHACLRHWKSPGQKSSKCIYSPKRPKRCKSSGLGNSLMQCKSYSSLKNIVHLWQRWSKNVLKQCVETHCFCRLSTGAFDLHFWFLFGQATLTALSFFFMCTKRKSNSSFSFHLQ